MNSLPERYFIINKPYNMVSQFVSSHKVKLLGDLDFHFPEGSHAIGRLDSYSEGLLIVTTNKAITRLLFHAESPHKRTYLVQVKNVVSKDSLARLRQGVNFKIQGGVNYTAKPDAADIVQRPGGLFLSEFEIPAHLPQSWLQMTLTEGKFHQVRKMVAAIHHPCRRLIRLSIEDLSLDDLPAGCARELKENDFFEKLKIRKPAGVAAM